MVKQIDHVAQIFLPILLLPIMFEKLNLVFGFCIFCLKLGECTGIVGARSPAIDPDVLWGLRKPQNALPAAGPLRCVASVQC